MRGREGVRRPADDRKNDGRSECKRSPGAIAAELICEVSHVTLEDGLPGGDPLRLDGVRRLVCGRDLAAGCQPTRSRGGGERSRGQHAPDSWARETLGVAFANEKNQTIAAFCLVGAAIGAGLGLAGGLSNWRLGPQVLRMVRGFVAGGLGGIVGGSLGAMIYQTFSTTGIDGSSVADRWWLRPVGWMAAGAWSAWPMACSRCHRTGCATA